MYAIRTRSIAQNLFPFVFIPSSSSSSSSSFSSYAFRSKFGSSAGACFCNLVSGCGSSNPVYIEAFWLCRVGQSGCAAHGLLAALATLAEAVLFEILGPRGRWQWPARAVRAQPDPEPRAGCLMLVRAVSWPWPLAGCAPECDHNRRQGEGPGRNTGSAPTGSGVAQAAHAWQRPEAA